MKRATAVKVMIKEINQGTYIKRPGWEPSGVLTRYGELSRVNIYGIVVSIDVGENSFIVDDGTGTVLVRYFEPPKKMPNVADIVNVIGRPREWNDSKYVSPEIVKTTTREWFNLFKSEVQVQRTKAPTLPVETEDQQEDINIGPYQKILNTIAMLDKGDGVKSEDIIKHLKMKDVDTLIQTLISEGEIFEISSGKVKVLE